MTLNYSLTCTFSRPTYTLSHTLHSTTPSITDLAKATSEACKASRAENCPFKFLYPLTDSLKTKIETICREMYGAVGVEYTEQAEKRLEVSVLYVTKYTVCIMCLVYTFNTLHS